MSERALTAESRTAAAGLTLLRLATWCWLLAVLFIGTAGMSATYRDPSLIRIDELSAIYESVGLSDQLMMTVILVLPLAFALASGGLIAARRPNDRAALLLAMGVVGLYYFTSGAYAGIGTPWLRSGSASIAMVLVAVFLVAFPTGTFRPMWSMAAPMAATAIAVTAPSMAADTRVSLTDWSPAEVPWEAWGGWSFILIVAAAAQVTRYRSISTERERNQTRWVMLGAFGIVTPGALLALKALGVEYAILTGGLSVLSSLGAYVLPATLLIAVFRYHLYDIDAVISRTVTYSLVAIVVGAAFVIPVLALGSVLGESSDLVVAGSTLLAAAVFTPARRRIQRSVERRFNRTGYDAENVMERFVVGLRADLSVDSVAARLEREVDHSLQPAATSVWVRGQQ